MSCLLAPLAQAIVTSVIRKANAKAVADPSASPFLRQLPALEKMLWGGSVMLIVDHAINGELFTWMPLEILKVGVPMCLVLTAVWAVWVLMKARQEKVNTSHFQTS